MTNLHTREWQDRRNENAKRRYRTRPEVRLADINRARRNIGLGPLESLDQARLRVPIEGDRA